jgi:hypothetical protein
VDESGLHEQEMRFVMVLSRGVVGSVSSLEWLKAGV